MHVGPAAMHHCKDFEIIENDAMFINTNTLSLNAQRNLSNTSRMFSKTLKRLSSGMRVNSAGDDAAGLAISTGLEAQRRGIQQSIRNINDAKGFLSTTEGALQVQSDLVQRMRELAIQSANGTLSNADRGYLNGEFQQLVAEFSRLASQTEFNGTFLLDGNFGTKRLQVGASKRETINLGLDSSVASQVFTKTIGTGTFQAGSTFELLYDEYDLQLKDVNDDGYGDLIGLRDYGSTQGIVVQLGYGDGLFSAGKTYSLGQYVDAVRVFDFNGDGKEDLLSFVDTPGEYNITVQLGNGNGTFQTAIESDAIGSDPGGYIEGSNLDIADFNNDNILDVAVTSSVADEIQIFLGYGDGRFRSAVTTFLSGVTNGIKAVDFNNDGKTDIVEAHTSSFAAVFLGNGNGTFQSRTTYLVSGTDAYGVTADDFNNDGYADFIATDATGLGNVYLGNGNGTFQARRTFNINFGAGDIDVLRTADLNGDGYQDLVLGSDGQGPVGIFIGNGNGTFKTVNTYGNYGASISLGEVNNDGAVDILTLDDDYASVQTLINRTQTASAVSDLTIANQEDAEDVLAILDTALAKLNRNRSTIGALQSRLSSAENVSLTLSENISSAKSQMLDADMASEMAEFSKYQILQNAGVSVLTQANGASRIALDLLSTIR